MAAPIITDPLAECIFLICQLQTLDIEWKTLSLILIQGLTAETNYTLADAYWDSLQIRPPCEQDHGLMTWENNPQISSWSYYIQFHIH